MQFSELAWLTSAADTPSFPADTQPQSSEIGEQEHAIIVTYHKGRMGMYLECSKTETTHQEMLIHQ